jgi:hypothetical protein
LGCALRYFAGGSPYDLMVKFGIWHTEVLDSVWFVVQAINKLKQFFIEYPADHNKQKQIASSFCYASTFGFSSCAGAIDGTLIWISKPSEIDAVKCGVGRKKFFCGQKNKFGLNWQAVSDCCGCFLDSISILYGGSSSDCIAFEESKLWAWLEYDGLLAPGIFLFGDNAYLNAPHFLQHRIPMFHGVQRMTTFFAATNLCWMCLWYACAAMGYITNTHAKKQLP